MKIEFNNDEVRAIIQAHAEELLNVEIDDSEEVSVSITGYAPYGTIATVAIEKREAEPLKVEKQRDFL
jgi:hypothetical protein